MPLNRVSPGRTACAFQGLRTSGRVRGGQYVTAAAACSTAARGSGFSSGRDQRRSQAPGFRKYDDKRRFSRLQGATDSLPSFILSKHPFAGVTSNPKQSQFNAVMTDLSLRLPALEDANPWIVHQKLFDILNEYLQSSSSTAPSAAAKEIDSLLPKKRHGLDSADDAKPKEDEESFLLETWNTFIEISRQIPSHHASQDRLVDLIKALSELPPTDAEIWGSTVKVWTDLPLLGPAMREAWIGPEGGKRPSPSEEQRWINQNAFAARLLNFDQVSWSNFAVWSLRSGLEESPENDAECHECNVAAAAQWMLHSGSYLSKEVKIDAAKEEQEQVEAQTETQPNRGRPLAAGTLYRGKGKERLCPERWQFWKQQFDELAQQGRVQNVKTMAQLAREKMDSVE